jgi:hypothetical protein
LNGYVQMLGLIARSVITFVIGTLFLCAMVIALVTDMLRPQRGAPARRRIVHEPAGRVSEHGRVEEVSS